MGVQKERKSTWKDQASDTLSDFHANGGTSSLLPIHLARN